jgi:hypothetical protein
MSLGAGRRREFRGSLIGLAGPSGSSYQTFGRMMLSNRVPIRWLSGGSSGWEAASRPAGKLYELPASLHDVARGELIRSILRRRTDDAATNPCRTSLISRTEWTF